MDNIEQLKRIGWGLEGDSTLNMKDRLDREAAAREEAAITSIELLQEAQRRRKHEPVEDEWFPGYCDLCGVNLTNHGWVLDE